MYEKTVALIPSYEPDEMLIRIAEELNENNIPVIVINDGSGPEYNAIYEETAKYAVVLTHIGNEGKGAGLKTGLSYIKYHYDSGTIIVTLDSDGQHKLKDVIATVDEAAKHPGELTLGVRAFDKDVPLRSRIGNSITCFVYRISTGIKVQDTQTGLRAFDYSLIDFMLNIEGNRYEYEMNVLLECSKHKIGIFETTIETIYYNNNAKSHFSTLRDSIRIYGNILKFAASSFISFLVDYAAYAVLSAVTGGLGAGLSVLTANVAARVLSSSVNFIINKKIVFKNKSSVIKTAVQYFLLAAGILCLNTICLSFLVNFGINKYAAKVIIEVAFFTVSYLAQKFIIFRKKEYTAEKKEEGLIMGLNKKISKRGLIWTTSFTLALTLFTTYVMLDAFVIPRSYSQAATTASASSSVVTTASAASDTAVSTDSLYNNGNINITLTKYREDDTDIYVADITLSSVSALKTAFANDTYGKNITQKTSDMSESHNAVLAINGDYYSARSGYVIRNGVLYRSTSAGSSQQDLVIYSDGSFEVIKEGDITAEELLNKGAWQVLSFGPGLVINSAVSVDENTEVAKAMNDNPRTAIGMIDDLHYVMVVADGRTTASTGLSLYQLANFMNGLGVKTAYNLDGGGSSTMYFNGKIVNEPTTNGKSISERKVSDIVYIG